MFEWRILEILDLPKDWDKGLLGSHAFAALPGFRDKHLSVVGRESMAHTFWRGLPTVPHIIGALQWHESSMWRRRSGRRCSLLTWRERLQLALGPGMLAGITFSDWIALLRRNRIDFSHWTRAASITEYSLMNSLFRWYEKRKWTTPARIMAVSSP
jgi:hypothetical protein